MPPPSLEEPLSTDHFGPKIAGQVNTIEQAFCLLFAEQMKAAAASALQAIEWPEGAINNTTRAKQLEQLDNEIIRLESEERELVTQAQQSGMLLT